MLGTIYFDNELGGMAVKIHDKMSNCFLPLKTHRIAAEKVIPEVVFLLGSVFPQFLCKGNHFLSIRQ